MSNTSLSLIWLVECKAVWTNRVVWSMCLVVCCTWLRLPNTSWLTVSSQLRTRRVSRRSERHKNGLQLSATGHAHGQAIKAYWLNADSDMSKLVSQNTFTCQSNVGTQFESWKSISNSWLNSAPNQNFASPINALCCAKVPIFGRRPGVWSCLASIERWLAATEHPSADGFQIMMMMMMIMTVMKEMMIVMWWWWKLMMDLSQSLDHLNLKVRNKDC